MESSTHHPTWSPMSQRPLSLRQDSSWELWYSSTGRHDSTARVVYLMISGRSSLKIIEGGVLLPLNCCRPIVLPAQILDFPVPSVARPSVSLSPAPTSCPSDNDSLAKLLLVGSTYSRLSPNFLALLLPSISVFKRSLLVISRTNRPCTSRGLALCLAKYSGL